jgi:hypothetical protein
MPRFYFHLYDDVESLDREGLELASVELAVAVASHELRQFAAYGLQRHGRVTMSDRIDIADEHGRVIDTVRCEDVVTLTE